VLLVKLNVRSLFCFPFANSCDNGPVYLVAHHIITGLKVAVKILNKGKIKHMEMAEKVRREINILKMCTHPHIIRLYVVCFCVASQTMRELIVCFLLFLDTK
jgi:serine/threonine protein kinase